MEVIGYNNYLIYPDGKVSSKRFPERYLRACVNIHGYYYLNLYKDGEKKTHKIHRLVALHYIPKPENKNEVDHINRVKTDNRVENLRWVTSSENNQNKGNQKNNKSGHKNIYYDRTFQMYKYKKSVRGKLYQRYFKTLTEALCYKYIFQLKIKSEIV